MLDRSPTAEPGIVGRVEQECGTVVPVDYLTRKDDFVADLDAHFQRWPSKRRGQGQTLWAGPWMVRVTGYTPLESATGLFWINITMLIAFFIFFNALAIPPLIAI